MGQDTARGLTDVQVCIQLLSFVPAIATIAHVIRHHQRPRCNPPRLVPARQQAGFCHPAMCVCF